MIYEINWEMNFV